ncbi:MAG TPA: 23S rRNA (guanosine(2251)-2'-O)-methyltransferase RlmB [Synergistetes bacterium]|nr:23S rRNA (guanosine(2251)-2'-O)-methyltransferase RlmB [Synergistota bacterium]
MTERQADERSRDEDICFGRNSVRSAIASTPKLCSRVMISESLSGKEKQETTNLCRDAGVAWQMVKPALLDALVTGGRHQGFVVRLSSVPLLEIEDLESRRETFPGPDLLLVLDHLQDPQNLGAVARSAEVFGAGAIIIPRRRSALPTSTVMRTSAGAIARIPVAGVVNITRTLEMIKKWGYWIVGLHHESRQILGKTPLPERTVLVVGGEDSGISRLATRSCDHLLRIPMVGITGSLNSATAAAIGMYEWRRAVDKVVGHE